MNFKAMVETIDIYEEIARTVDRSTVVRNRIVRGEPQFSRRGDLYPNLSQRLPDEHALALKWLIHYADGSNDLLTLSEMSGLDIDLLWEVAARGIALGVFERVGR